MTSDRWLGAAILREKSWWVDCETEREMGRKADGRNKSNRHDSVTLIFHLLLWPKAVQYKKKKWNEVNYLKKKNPLLLWSENADIDFGFGHCWLLLSDIIGVLPKINKLTVMSKLNVVYNRLGNVNLCLVYNVYTLDIIKQRAKLFLTFQLSLTFQGGLRLHQITLAPERRWF